MKKHDQEADKDFQLLLKRLGIVILLAFLGFGAVKFMEELHIKPSQESNIYSDTVFVRTNDSVISEIIIKYVFDKSNSVEFYRRNIHFPVLEALKRNALKLNWSHPDILMHYRAMTNETVRFYISGIVWRDYIITINHNPKVLKLLEERNEGLNTTHYKDTVIDQIYYNEWDVKTE